MLPEIYSEKPWKVNRDISFLRKEIRPKLVEIVMTARDEGLSVAFFEGARSSKRQDWLYDRGASKVTSQSPGAFHVLLSAFDLVFLDPYGRWSWDRLRERDARLSLFYQYWPTAVPDWNWNRLGEIGKSLDLEWGGDWGWDRAHFQLRM